MKNSFFGKTIENVRKLRDIKLAATEKRRNYLVSERNDHTIKIFTENLSSVKMRKTQILMNKPVHQGLPILDLSKIVMHEFWYGYVKPKYFEKKQNFVHCSLKKMICTKTLQKMLKEDLTLQIKN